MVKVSGLWYHITCVNNFKELYFTKDYTEIVGKVNKQYFDLTCSVCKIK